MKAIQFTRFGTPDVLELIDAPTPKATGGNALVQISAAAINPSDVKNVASQMEGTVLPRIPGRDFAGIVVDGPDDWVGAEVFGTGGDIGFTRDGSHAEAILLPAQALVRKPTNLSLEQAASIGVNFVIAWLGAIGYRIWRAAIWRNGRDHRSWRRGRRCGRRDRGCTRRYCPWRRPQGTAAGRTRSQSAERVHPQQRWSP
jgi:NADPH:quinone reductase-like Zn-dependent oxidoreductase